MSASAMITRMAIALTMKIAPARHAEWTRAALAEMDEMPPDAGVDWALGLVIAAIKLRFSEPSMMFARAALATVAVVVTVDWTTANDTISLATLIVAAGTLGFRYPERKLPSTAVIGTALLVAHGVGDVWSWARPFYQCKALTASEFLLLAALIFPSAAGVNAGVGLRALFTSGA